MERWIKMAAVLLAASALAGAAGAADRVAPARPLPVPSDISPQLQAIVAQPPPANYTVSPNTVEGWVIRLRAGEASGARTAADMAARLHVTVSARTMGDVTVFDVVPESVAAENRNRLLIHIHAGCYVLGGGAAATVEAILMAGLGRYRVLSIDYRMPPAAYFPAALDDVITVWKEALRTHDPSQMAVFGSSAGGALTLAMVHQATKLGLPLPGAIAPGTPESNSCFRRERATSGRHPRRKPRVVPGSGELSSCRGGADSGNHPRHDFFRHELHGALGEFGARPVHAAIDDLTEIADLLA
jgi:acetyl esterase/lipase